MILSWWWEVQRHYNWILSILEFKYIFHRCCNQCDNDWILSILEFKSSIKKEVKKSSSNWILSILEFKYLSYFYGDSDDGIESYPYWNLNPALNKFRVHRLPIESYPYWNLNMVQPMVKSMISSLNPIHIGI